MFRYLLGMEVQVRDHGSWRSSQTHHLSPSTGTSNEVPRTQNEVAKETPKKPAAASPPPGVAKEIPAGIPGNKANNYFRADGQNFGNFLTVEP
ncbi:Protein SPIRAL1-like 3 [Hibiscus syriacus]|uniref:Protein SPIRAL1-like 3 n=1 Tax=Hibiscus syriacus TaxID=106335 RepID=A0A6A2YQ23_HIBSY|nr:Protein SPIRAL1-like 3 [Hibiscus syriacus]